LRTAVGRLDEDRRLVVLLCYHAGMTHAQAAEILDLPLGTLKSRLHAALTELRAMLGAEVTP
jgi:RNA polymerase sigma-70 factor (ECF subfamily)